MVQMPFDIIVVIEIIIQVCKKKIFRFPNFSIVFLVKGVNFYGRNSEYVISGSDCGHVFIWDKESEKCIWYDKGDDDGTVNVLEPHPHFPIIATSGLEHDVKIWAPLSQESVDFKRLKTVRRSISKESFE
jgi:WD repeat-containing protein 42A